MIPVSGIFMIRLEPKHETTPFGPEYEEFNPQYLGHHIVMEMKMREVFTTSSASSYHKLIEKWPQILIVQYWQHCLWFGVARAGPDHEGSLHQPDPCSPARGPSASLSHQLVSKQSLKK